MYVYAYVCAYMHAFVRVCVCWLRDALYLSLATIISLISESAK